MATKILINFEYTGPNFDRDNGIIENAEFLPNVGEYISLKGRAGIVRERRFAFGYEEGGNGVLLFVTPTPD